MRPLLAHDTLAQVLFFLSIALLGTAEAFMTRRMGIQGKRTREWTVAFVLGAIALGILAGAYAVIESVSPLPGGGWWPVLAGLALMWAGIGFRLWAIATLGRFFQLTVTIQDDHQVIERGPYRRLRHPSYLGALVALLGIGLAEGSWLSVAAMLLAGTLAFVVRIRAEERLLMDELGDAYADYARRTSRLLPGVY